MARRRTRLVAASMSALAVTALAVGQSATAHAAAATDPFFTYSGSAPLASFAPGAVLGTRTITAHLFGFPTPLPATQILFRSTNQLGQPIAAVTSVIRPLVSTGPAKLVTYDSAYDSLDPLDGPSHQLAGGLTLGGVTANAENEGMVALSQAGLTINIPDFEGPAANYVAGRESGETTLDSIRAVDQVPSTGVTTSTKVGLVGYSGGALGADWAAQLAPSYAPDVNAQLVGAAIGGILADAAHAVQYISGTVFWSPLLAAALNGLTRAYGVDLTPYLSSYGIWLLNRLKTADVQVNVLGQYPGLTWAKMFKPQYANPDSVPAYVSIANDINMAQGPAPTIPMLMGQGGNGILEGTPNSPTFGNGDGVMLAGDTRTLARQYCAAGDSVEYKSYPLTSHVTSLPQWAADVVSWLVPRFNGAAAPSNCGSIPAGNSLAPETVVAPGS